MNHILLVENDPNWRNIEGRMLEESGYRVITARNSEEAIRILEKGDNIDLVISDLHMDGKNGDEVLEYMIEKDKPTPFALASGTICPKDNRALAEQIPFIYFLEKDAFTGTGLVQKNIEHILRQPKPEYGGKKEHVEFLRRFKQRLPPSDIRVYADRVNGWLKRTCLEFGPEMQDVEIEEESFSGIPDENQTRTLRDLLDNYSCFGTDASNGLTTKDQLHTLKNLLDGYSRKTTSDGLAAEMLRLAADIKVNINIPPSESMTLGEIVFRASEHLENLYGASIDLVNSGDTAVPMEMQLPQHSNYILAFRALFENALSAAAKCKAPSVKVSYKDKQLHIENPGLFPAEALDSESHIVSEKLPLKKGIGSGFGVDRAWTLLKEAGSDLTYQTLGGVVKAIVPLRGIGGVADENPPTGRILVYDRGGDRFGHIKNAIDNALIPDSLVDYKQDKEDYSLKDVDVTEYSGFLIHPDTHILSFAADLAELNPNARLMIVSGMAARERFQPGDTTGFYKGYRSLIPEGITATPMEDATYLSEAPTLEKFREFFQM